MSMTITRKEIIPLATYRQGRKEYFQKMLAYKQDRRVKLAENISLLFENKSTVLFQIHELVHAEDLTDSNEIDEYIDIYSDMLPNENELSATLFIEMDDQNRLEELLIKLKGIEHYLTLTIGNETVQAVFEEVHDDRDFTTSVHYLKFPLTQTAKNELVNGDPANLQVTLELSHPHLAGKVALSPNNIKSIQKDLA